MKLLDVMKKYDRCLVRESAKLTKIYNMLLKESGAEDELEEEACPDCGNDPCTCESDDDTATDEAEEVISAEDFFAEADKETDECDLIPEKDFINCEGESEEVEENDMLRNRPHNAHVNDPRGVIAEDDDKETDEAEEMISAEEFFAESDDDKETDESEDDDKKTDESEDTKTDEAEEMMSAEEFFAEAENTENDESDDDKETDESEDDDKKTDESEDTKTDEAEEMMSAEEFFAESDDDKETDESEDTDTNESEEDEKKLQESLKSYRRKNHRLFND